MLRSKYRGMPVVAVCTTIVGVLAIRAIAHTQQSELASFAPVQITESFESVMDGRRGGAGILQYVYCWKGVRGRANLYF